MSSKHKALFALTVFMIGMLSASDAEAGIFFRNRRPVFGRLFGRLAERIEQRLERRLGRLQERDREEGKQAAKPPAGNGAGNAGDGAGAGGPGAGGGQNQIANQAIAPVAPLDVCNVRLVRCSEQENADTKEKTPFCQVRSTPAGSPEEVLRVLKNGTLVVMRDDALTATTPEMVRFLGAQYEAIAAQQAQAGRAINPIMAAFRRKNQALLSSPAPQVCVGGVNDFGALASNQQPLENPGFPPYNPPAVMPPVTQAIPEVPRPPQDPGVDDAFDPAGLGTAQMRTTSSGRSLASRRAQSHAGGQTAPVLVSRKKRPVSE